MKTLIIDADTILYSSAAKEQINKCLAIHKKSGREKMFPSKTSFNEWLKESGKWTKDDFEFKSIPELVGETAYACSSVKKKVEAIVEASGCDDFQVCVQGTGNFRKERQAKFVAYKAQRTEKPLLFYDVLDYVIKKYKDKVRVSHGIETDDFITITAWDYLNNGKQDDLVIAAVDKDICQCSVGNMLNYFRLEDGIFFNTHEMQYKAFWTAVLVGDTADNIPGLLHVSDITKKQYGIKTTGCGKVGAARILSDTVSEQDCAERVMEAYCRSWPEDWRERLEEMCFFLWLQRKQADMFTFKTHVLQRLGIKAKWL